MEKIGAEIIILVISVAVQVVLDADVPAVCRPAGVIPGEHHLPAGRRVHFRVIPLKRAGSQVAPVCQLGEYS